MRREVAVSWHGYGGWFLGYTAGLGHKNVELRTAQFRGADNESICLTLAKGWVRAKLVNSRVLLRRNWRGEEPADAQLRSEEHTSELQSLMRISYAVFCLKKKKKQECNTSLESIAA